MDVANALVVVYYIWSKKTFILVVDVTQSDNVMVVDEFFIGGALGFP